METMVLLYKKIDNSKTVFPESIVARRLSNVVQCFFFGIHYLKKKITAKNE